MAKSDRLAKLREETLRAKLKLSSGRWVILSSEIANRMSMTRHQAHQAALALTNRGFAEMKASAYGPIARTTET